MFELPMTMAFSCLPLNCFVFGFNQLFSPSVSWLPTAGGLCIVFIHYFVSFFLHNTTTKLTVKWLDGRPGQGKYLIWSKSFSFVAVYLAILRSPFDISMTDLISKLWQESGSQPFAVPHPASYVPPHISQFSPYFSLFRQLTCAPFLSTQVLGGGREWLGRRGRIKLIRNLIRLPLELRLS